MDHKLSNIILLSKAALLALAMSSFSLHAQESGSIPATSQQMLQVRCQGSDPFFGSGADYTIQTETTSTYNSWYVPCANAAYRTGTFQDNYYQYTFDKIGADPESTTTGPTKAKFTRILLQDNSQSDTGYVSTGHYTKSLITVYTCPEGYTLNGTMCDPEIQLEPYCGLDTPVFTSNTAIPVNRFCQAMPDGVSQCEYQATTESSGAINGYSFTPTGESCDSCGQLGTLPCVQHTQNTSPTEPPQNGSGQDECFATGGVVWCPDNPQDRCSNYSCDTNCGYIGDSFYCGDTTQPDSTPCIAGDTRPECGGMLEGECPPGYDCSEPVTDTSTVDSNPCVENDTRAGCQGRPTGSLPDIDLTGLENLMRQNVNNTAEIKDLLSGKGVSQSEIKAQADAETQKVTDAITSTNQQITDFVTNQTGEEGDALANIGGSHNYFSALVANLLPTPSGSCSPYVINFVVTAVTLDICGQAQILKVILAWVINLTIIMYVFHAVTVRTAPVLK